MARGKGQGQRPSGGRGQQGGRGGQQARGGQGRRGDARRPQGSQGRPQAGQRGRRPSQASQPVPDLGLIEGRRAVAEALEQGVPLKSAFVSDADATDATLARLAARLDEAGVPVERVPRSRLDALSSHGAHQGIMVRTRPFAYASLKDVILASGTGEALVVVLDHVTDEGNFGAIVRSAEVVGAAGVVIPSARSARVGVGAYKTSAGAVLHLPIAQVPNLASAIDELKEAGFWVAAASEHAQEDVWHAPLSGRIALVMGSVGAGVSRLVQERCDFACRLPQRGHVESLNVAQAATVLMYEWLRRSEEAAAEAPASGEATEGGEA